MFLYNKNRSLLSLNQIKQKNSKLPFDCNLIDSNLYDPTYYKQTIKLATI